MQKLTKYTTNKLIKLVFLYKISVVHKLCLRLNTESKGRFNTLSIAQYIFSALYTSDVPPCPSLQVSGYKKKFQLIFMYTHYTCKGNVSQNTVIMVIRGCYGQFNGILLTA